jgi:hypothetical protein
VSPTVSLNSVPFEPITSRLQDPLVVFRVSPQTKHPDAKNHEPRNGFQVIADAPPKGQDLYQPARGIQLEIAGEAN